MTVAVRPSPQSEFRHIVERQSGQQILRCYQCGKCSAGCPSALEMDLTPRQVMRAIQLGQEEMALGSTSIWLCVFCETCSARCPKEIDIARVMESLRLLAYQKGIRPAQKEVAVFHRLFLGQTKRQGHIWELGLAAQYNLTSGHPLTNMKLLPGMLSRGKLPLLPPRGRASAETHAIFAKVEELEKELRTKENPKS